MLDIDPYANDPGRWGASLVTLAELIVPCLDAAGARSVVEVGAYAGDLTRLLRRLGGRLAARASARSTPRRSRALVALAEERPELRAGARDEPRGAARRSPLPDAVIIDGDHNYFTVSEELRLIAERAAGDELPLLLFHDVGWPHARRDDYYDPEPIPAEHRQPIEEGDRLFPGESGRAPRRAALPLRRARARAARATAC